MNYKNDRMIFEYKLIEWYAETPCSEGIQENINQYGAEGWEVCTTHFEKDDDPSFYRIFVWLKRSKN